MKQREHQFKYSEQDAEQMKQRKRQLKYSEQDAEQKNKEYNS